MGLVKKKDIETDIIGTELDIKICNSIEQENFKILIRKYLQKNFNTSETCTEEKLVYNKTNLIHRINR